MDAMFGYKVRGWRVVIEPVPPAPAEARAMRRAALWDAVVTCPMFWWMVVFSASLAASWVAS